MQLKGPITVVLYSTNDPSQRESHQTQNVVVRKAREDLLAKEDIALDGVVLPYDMALVIKAIFARECGGAGLACDEVGHAVLADGGVALHVIGFQPGHQRFGRKAVVDDLLVGGILVG